MKYLLTLPKNIASGFHALTGLSHDQWFATSDPESGYLGSGGGTVNLLLSSWRFEEGAEGERRKAKEERRSLRFQEWIKKEKRILIHSGGQSRRLPAYGPMGKIFTPVPVLRWKKGQRLDQTLLDLQLPLLEKILNHLPDGMNTLVVSGDVLIRANGSLPAIPDADVVAFGHWVSPELASRHGIFFTDRFGKNEFQFMLQKPTPEEISNYLPDYLFMIDVGIWALSDKAVEELCRRSGIDGDLLEDPASIPPVQYYDMYGDFGLELGASPRNGRHSELTSAVLPLPGGEFYHFGTSRELISSNLELQNKVNDQREIIHRQIKPHPAVFIQNSISSVKLNSSNENIWIENSFIGPNWTLEKDHIITGVPENDWTLTLPAGLCLDFVPINKSDYCIRIYHIDDRFDGVTQEEKRFPVLPMESINSDLLQKLIDDFLVPRPASRLPSSVTRPASRVPKLSASDLLNQTNLTRLYHQRSQFRLSVLPSMAANYRHSIFYHLDLEQLARDWSGSGHALPTALPAAAPEMTRIHDQMFRAQVKRVSGVDFQQEENEAFGILRESLIKGLKLEPAKPKLTVYSDQVVWGRSPVRLDLGGGWTDTPPNCILNGGRVVNVAVELNGQAPLQVFIKPTSEPRIVLRSIDLGLREEVTKREQLAAYNEVGSAFAIPKAALVLAGFGEEPLVTELKELGGGLEISMLVAVPKGSGLGTSSILAATVLGSLSDYFGLDWDRGEIGRRTLALEQMLTTGGGWQDQYGGIYHGLKILETTPGFNQAPVVRWLPTAYFTQPEMRSCLLLYYTGITRIAKSILGEIVRGMFLNSNRRLQLIDELGQHANDLMDNILMQDWPSFGKLIDKSWKLNQALDKGTNPPEVQAILAKIADLYDGQKLLGAGGGGYMFIIAKDPAAALKIKKTLQVSPPNERARFVDFGISSEGLVVTRS
jgi:galactokinase/mevalonate kinase-like predicted kinase